MATKKSSKLKRRIRKRKKAIAKVKIRTMDLILVFIIIAGVTFTREMIALYKETGMIPDTLCTCVFAALFGECGAMAFIKTAKERRQDRKWQQEDIRRAEEAAKELSKGGTP